ncbi:MAG TPA: DnaJ domain-containing protein [Candidatus Acidoferrales bacterium]|nr:DnaJ domain-containing protein [Candidatus Acidoferrales bacterium]
MNYYEELGIHGDATTVEIREAYKLVARLLHPDKHREPRLKDLAECQMKRLSDVLAVLLNPQERARYDAGLANGGRLELLTPLAPANEPGILQTVVRHWFWVLLGSTAIGMGVWYGLARGPDAAPGFAAMDRGTVPTAPVSPGKRAPVNKRRVKPGETTGKPSAERPSRHAAGEEPEPMVSARVPTPAESPAEAAKEKQAGMPAMPKAEPADGARSGVESRFAGEWLYAADGREPGAAGTYPATYVECRLREESGILAGDYRALHRVADKAISREVVFRLRGESPARSTGKLGWESNAGAKGEVELTLLSPNQLQVKWWTTQFGRQEALSSGMAVLIRLRTP